MEISFGQWHVSGYDVGRALKSWVQFGAAFYASMIRQEKNVPQVTAGPRREREDVQHI